MSQDAAIASELDRLEGLGHAELTAEWIKLMDAKPPKASSRKYLMRALAYELQCKRISRLTKRELKALSTLGKTGAVKAPVKPKRTAVTLSPGAKLMRDWNGRSYTVSVIEEGFVYQNKVWGSLSAIARDITGAHWSGPRFFGINGNAVR